MAEKPESPITLVVRRGALRRYHKLQKDTANLPVVVAWDRRSEDRPPAEEVADALPEGERRREPSFTWDLADFIVVPGGEQPQEAAAPADPVKSEEADPVTSRPSASRRR